MSEYGFGDLERNRPTNRDRLQRLGVHLTNYFFLKFAARDLEAEKAAEENRETAAELVAEIIEASMARAEEFYPEDVQQVRATFTSPNPSEAPLMQVDVFSDDEASFKFGHKNYEFVGGELAYFWVDAHGEREHPFVTEITDVFNLEDFLNRAGCALDNAEVIDVTPLDISSR